MSDDDGFEEYAAHVIDSLVPMIRSSEVVASIVPRNETDVKYAVELGLSIMFDKPIILVVFAGAKIPDHLARVADAIIEDEPDLHQRLGDTVARLGMAR